MPKHASHKLTTKLEDGGDAKNQADENDDASSRASLELPFGEEVVGREVMILFEMEGKRTRVPFLGRVVSYAVTLVEEEPPEPRKLPCRKGKKAEAAAASPTSTSGKAHKPSFTDEIERKFRVIFEDGDDQWMDLHYLKAQGLLWWQDVEPMRKKPKVTTQAATAPSPNQESAPLDDKESAKSSSLESVDAGKKSPKSSKKSKKKSSKDSSTHDNDDDDDANINDLAAFMQQFAAQSGGGGAFPVMTMPPNMMSMMMMPQQQQQQQQHSQQQQPPQAGGMFMTPWGPWFPPSANSSPWKGGG